MLECTKIFAVIIGIRETIYSRCQVAPDFIAKAIATFICFPIGPPIIGSAAKVMTPLTPTVFQFEGKARICCVIITCCLGPVQSDFAAPPFVVQEAEAARNKASKQIGAAMGKGDKEEAERLKTEVAGAKNVISAMGAQVDSEKAMLNDLLSSLPNLPFHEVPDGESEDENVELTKWGEPRAFVFEPKSHSDLGEALGQMDFETAAKMSGSRFVVLRGALSRLDRALAALMLDMQVEEGFEETSPPFLVWPKALYGTSQLPKFAEDLYKAGDDHYLRFAKVGAALPCRRTLHGRSRFWCAQDL